MQGKDFRDFEGFGGFWDFGDFGQIKIRKFFKKYLPL
jgi:hypothetical protein